MKLDNNNELPLYVQLAKILRSDIENGKYKKGEKIPTEAELSRIYKVSRITVRNALDELTKEDILIRRRGKGTFIDDHKLARSIAGIQSFTQICQEIGCVPGAKVIKCILEDATDEDCEKLGIPDGSKVLVIDRIRYADHVPVSMEISRFPESFSFLLSEDLNDCSMFAILENKYNVKLQATRKCIELVYASYEMSMYLNIPKNHPLLLITSVSCDTSGKPVHRSMQYIVGDKFKLLI